MAASHKDESFFAQESPGSTSTLLRGDRKRISYISDSSSGLSLDFSNTATTTTVCDQSAQDDSSDQHTSSSSFDLSSVKPLTLDPPERIHLREVHSFELIDRYDELNPVPNLPELYSTDIDMYARTMHPSITSTCAEDTHHITSTSIEIPSEVQRQNLDTSHSAIGSNPTDSCDDPHTYITVEDDECGSGTEDFPQSTVNMPISDQDTDREKGRFISTLVLGCHLSREGIKDRQC